MWKEVKTVFRKYAVFDGRSKRSEYWYFWLFNLCLSIVVVSVCSLCLYPAIMDGTETGIIVSGSIICIYSLYELASIVPHLAVTCRRLHDTNRSGACIFISLIPVVGAIILLIWLCEQSTYGDNAYGPSPADTNDGVSRARESGYADNPVTAPMPAPAIPAGRRQAVHEPSVRIKLLCNTGALAGQVFSSGDTLCIGRSKSNCNVVFPAETKGISRIHCCLKLRHGQVMLMDMGSSCGTFLQDGTKLKPNEPVIVNDNTRFYLAGRETSFTVYMEIG